MQSTCPHSQQVSPQGTVICGKKYVWTALKIRSTCPHSKQVSPQFEGNVIYGVEYQSGRATLRAIFRKYDWTALKMQSTERCYPRILSVVDLSIYILTIYLLKYSRYLTVGSRDLRFGLIVSGIS